jgi:methanogenic corrinoid protein MtbC1
MSEYSDTAKPRHPIQVVSRRTGISPDVLRAWERRYGAVTPNRSDTRRRLYSDADIDRLLLLRRATETGHSIGQVAELSDGELRTAITEDLTAVASRVVAPADTDSPATAAETLDSALQAVRELDASALQSALNRASLVLSPSDLIEHVFVPLIRTVGDEWHRGQLGIAHEHLASAIVRGLLSDLALLRHTDTSGPGLIVATPAGQLHELGALVVAATASSSGWSVTYLGPDVPAADIADAARRRGAQAVALSITLPDTQPDLSEELRSLRDLLAEDTVVVVGGMAAPAYLLPSREIGALLLGDMPSLRAILSTLRSKNGGQE